VKRGAIKRKDRVSVLSTAHGLNFVDFKERYHAQDLAGIASDWANPPIELPADFTSVRDRMRTEIDRRFGRS
jgi:threonine synthase